MTSTGTDAVSASQPIGLVTEWSPTCALAGDPLPQVSETMTAENCGALLVRRQGGVVGIVSERDIVQALAAGTDHTDWATDVMTRDLVSVDANTPIAEVAELMQEANIRHMVVDDVPGRRVGIVSIRDVVGPLLASMQTHG